MRVVVEVAIVARFSADGAGIGFVGGNSALVGGNGIIKAADTIPGVAGHVHHMWCARCQPTQPRCRASGLGRIGAGFGEVNEQVDGLWLIGRAGQYLVHQRQRRAGPSLRNLAAGFPIVPGLAGHDGFGCKDGDQIVIRPALGQHDHRIGIQIAVNAILGAAGGVPGVDGFHQGAITIGKPVAAQCSRGECPGLCNGFGCDRAAVDIGAKRQSFTPAAHGARGIAPPRFAEAFQRLVIIKAPKLAETLIEIGLRGRHVRNRHMRRGEAGHQHDSAACRFGAGAFTLAAHVGRQRGRQRQIGRGGRGRRRRAEQKRGEGGGRTDHHSRNVIQAAALGNRLYHADRKACLKRRGSCASCGCVTGASACAAPWLRSGGCVRGSR